MNSNCYLRVDNTSIMDLLFGKKIMYWSPVDRLYISEAPELLKYGP